MISHRQATFYPRRKTISRPVGIQVLPVCTSIHLPSVAETRGKILPPSESDQTRGIKIFAGIKYSTGNKQKARTLVIKRDKSHQFVCCSKSFELNRLKGLFSRKRRAEQKSWKWGNDGS